MKTRNDLLELSYCDILIMASFESKKYRMAGCGSLNRFERTRPNTRYGNKKCVDSMYVSSKICHATQMKTGDRSIKEVWSYGIKALFGLSVSGSLTDFIEFSKLPSQATEGILCMADVFLFCGNNPQCLLVIYVCNGLGCCRKAGTWNKEN